MKDFIINLVALLQVILWALIGITVTAGLLKYMGWIWRVL